MASIIEKKRVNILVYKSLISKLIIYNPQEEKDILTTNTII